MRRLIALALPVVLVLGAPAAAPAKGIVGAKVCGADGCRTVKEADEALLGGGPPTDGPAAREPFVRLDIRVGVPGHVEHVRLLYLPRSELVLADDATTWMVPMARAELRAIARRVTAFGASELPAAVPLGGPAADAPLAPEVVGAPAPAAAGDGGIGGWWLALPGAVVAVAAGIVVARRRRRGPPAKAAGATG